MSKTHFVILCYSEIVVNEFSEVVQEIPNAEVRVLGKYEHDEFVKKFSDNYKDYIVIIDNEFLDDYENHGEHVLSLISKSPTIMLVPDEAEGVSTSKLIEHINHVINFRLHSPQIRKNLLGILNTLGKSLHEIALSDVPFSKREKDVLELMLKDRTNKQIAEELAISIRTVETHKHNMMNKAQVNTPVGLAVYCINKRALYH